MPIASDELNARPESTLVLVHGDFGNGLDAWAKFAEQVDDRFRVIVLDRPGFGRNEAKDGRYPIAGDARHALTDIRAAGVESFHLVGHSYGGVVAIEIARQKPDAIRSLHLIEPPLLQFLPDDPEVLEMDRRVRDLQATYDHEGDDATTAAFFAMIGAEHVVERLRGTPEWERLRGYADRFARNEPPGDFPPDVLFQLPPEIPIALYSGGRSHPALRAIAAALAEYPRITSFTDVPTAGHAVQMAGAAIIEPMFRTIDSADAAWWRRCSTSHTRRE